MGRYPERSTPSHPQLELIGDMAEALWEAAFAAVRVSARTLRRQSRRGNTTLRPGTETPSWNALADAIRPYLQKPGEKVLLARWLGLDASRVTEFFVKQSAMPDAERTLMLIRWLAARRAGRRPA